jgi:hypothetical protein
MISTHEAELDLPMLPPVAFHIHIVPALGAWHCLLLVPHFHGSIVLYAGNTVAFSASEVTVSINNTKDHRCRLRLEHYICQNHTTPDPQLSIKQQHHYPHWTLNP